MKASITKLLTLLIVATLFSSCNINMFNGISGNNNVVSENRDTKEDFSKIKVSTGLDLYLTQGTSNKITVEADENLQDLIITEVENGVLKIYSEKNIWKAKARKVYVTVKILEELSATSGADVYAKETIKVSNIAISATSGAFIQIYLDANSMETNATSGADIKVSGNAENHTSSATSGASIDGYELISKNGTAGVTSGAGIKMYASETIVARATSGGSISFKGNPKKVSKTSNSGDSVSAK